MSPSLTKKQEAKKRLPEGSFSEEEEPEIDLTAWIEVDGKEQEEEIDLTSMALTDEEIEENLQTLAKKKTTIKTAATSAFAIQALKLKAQKQSHDPTKPPAYTSGICAAPNCNQPAYTDQHISWCEKHSEELVAPIRHDFDAEIRKWPSFLQDRLFKFDNIHLTVDEIHRFLYEVVTPSLQQLQRDGSKPRKLRCDCRKALKAIATYKKRFNPVPPVAWLLLKLGLAILLAVYALFGPAVAFSCVAAAAVISAVIGVGVWRRDAFLLKMGCGALIGAGVGVLVLGPVGATAGALIGAGVAGYIQAEKAERKKNKAQQYYQQQQQQQQHSNRSEQCTKQSLQT